MKFNLEEKPTVLKIDNHCMRTLINKMRMYKPLEKTVYSSPFKLLIIVVSFSICSCSSNSASHFEGKWVTDNPGDSSVFEIERQGKQYVLQYNKQERLFDYNDTKSMLTSNDGETERDIALSEENTLVFYEDGVKILELNRKKERR